MATDLQRWGERQIALLVSLGRSPRDAERSIAWVLKMLPPGADPDHWLPTADELASTADITAGDIADARADWYASPDVPPQFKRILDARADA